MFYWGVIFIGLKIKKKKEIYWGFIFHVITKAKAKRRVDGFKRDFFEYLTMYG